MQATPRPILTRAIAALPDAVVAATFLVIWFAPFAFGPRGVRNAMLTMLIEFIIVHASGFLGAVAFAPAVSRGKKFAGLLGFALFYTVFVGAFVLIFDETWPILVFGWLLLGKFSGALAHHCMDAEEVRRQQAGWAMAVVFYIAGVFLTILLPMPRFGMSAALLPEFGLTGSGLWVEQPHRMVAFGFLYFAATMWFRWSSSAKP